ncbi:MAG TPA: RNA repair transcriptional activator RtcR [bacterium]|nr:RNA repair transcriptional activator RtcR [bacterium]
MKKTVVIGLLGIILDACERSKRWEKWRPTVSICQHEEFLIDRMELLCQPKFHKLANDVIEDIRTVSPETEVNLVYTDIEDPWDFEEVYGTLHDFARNYDFDPDNEEYLVHITTGTHVAQICLFLLTESHLIPGKLLQASPPKRKCTPMAGSYTVIDLDLSRYDKLASRFIKEKSDDISFLKSGIDTRNADFNYLIERIERVAINSKAPILLMGPTGAGKSQLARKIYELKKNRRQLSGSFVEVNCATVRGDAAMSALFGHVRGSFTGAMKDRAGLLRAADGGLLFLDEAGELGIDEQTMLLRALEEKVFVPLGADNEVRSDFQLICGTNRDLAEEVANKRFREDLLARINMWTFYMPGLKDRTEDIEPNLQYELDQFEQHNGIHVMFNKEARERFMAFASSPAAKWKANFRDLNGAIARMATLSTGGRITLDDVDEEIENLMRSWREPAAISTTSELLDSILGDRLEKIDPFDQAQLSYVVQVCKESSTLSDAGRKLYSISRNRKKNTNDADRLRKYLARFDIDWKDI